MRPSRTSIIVALLAGVFLLTLVQAVRSYLALTYHRFAAEAALRDYAAFAAVEFGRRARQGLFDAAVYGVLRPAATVNASLPRHRLPPPGILDAAPAERRRVDLHATGRIRTYFLMFLADGALRTGGASPPPAVARWLADAVPTHARAMHETGRYFGFVAGAPEGEPLAAAYLVRYDAANRPVVTYGFVMAAGDLAPVFRAVMAGTPLLPRASTAPLPNDSVLAARVLAPGGEPAFASLAPFDARFAAHDTLGAQYGGLVVGVAARPEAARRLVIGGLPRPRLAPALTMLALTALLLGVAVHQLRREAELARLRRDFVANVSHELRTPLAQIRMFAETLLLGRVRTDEEGRRSLDIVHQESRRLSHLVENLLLFSRAERGVRNGLTLEPTDLGPLVRDVVEGFRPLAAQRRVVVRLDGGAGLVAAVDPDALRQILLNLLDNTLKYGPEGQTVTVALAGEGSAVRLVVDDQGPGVPATARRRVFRPFTRLSPGSAGVTGTGLGLAVVHELVGRHGGRAWVEDAPGGGARFVVELPRAGGAPAA